MFSSSVMQALESEERGLDDDISLKETEMLDTTPWLDHVCPHRSSTRLTHPQTHLVAVAGLLVTGALVIYATALHLGYVVSDEAGAALAQSSLLLDSTLIDDAAASNSSAAANSTAAANSSAGVGSFPVAVPSAAPAGSLDLTSLGFNATQIDDAAAPSSSVAASSSAGAVPAAAPAGSLDHTSRSLNTTRIDDAAAASDSTVGANSSAGVGSFAVAVAAAAPAGSMEPAPPPCAIAARVYYQNMSEIWHSMSDKELLRKATSGERKRLRGGRSGGLKLAFMFMARGPLPLAALWERYFRGHEQRFSVYVHSHPDFVPTCSSRSPYFRRFVPSKVVLWGKLSVYEAERRLLGNALLDPTNAWFLLLSESCIPMVNFPETFAYFNNSPNVSFIESYQGSSRLGQGRLYRGRFKAMAPEITSANFRKGSQWFQITRPLALLAARDSPQYAKFRRHFCALHSVCYIDEHFLPTLAWIRQPHASLAFRTVTYYEFRDRSSHPKRFHASDTNKNLILWLREGQNCSYNGHFTSTCFLFARKFDPDALGVLLDLAAPIMGIPP